MPATSYYLQRTPVLISGGRSESYWEEVDEYVFKNWKFAVDEKGQSRYTGTRFTVEDGKIQIKQESALKGRDLIHIAKLSGSDHHDIQSQVPGGFCRNPEYVKIVKGNSTSIRQIGVSTFRAKLADTSNVIKATLMQTAEE